MKVNELKEVGGLLREESYKIPRDQLHTLQADNQTRLPRHKPVPFSEIENFFCYSYREHDTAPFKSIAFYN